MDDRNRVAVPRQVLEALGVGPGDHVVFVIDDGGVRLRRVDWRVS